MARKTGDPVRDLSAVVREQVKRALATRPDADRLVAVVEGERELDAHTLERLFGEELPAGLVLGSGR
jgi:phosphomannomutase